MSSQRENIDLTKTKLKEAKSLVKLFVLDYDGTIYDGKDYKESNVLDLVEKIINQKKLVAIITARAATALKVIAPPLQEFLSKKKITTPIFIAGGNGTVLYKVTKDTLIKIYSHGLSVSEINHAINSWKKVYRKFKINRNDLAEKGLETFQKFLRDDWTNYIPDQIIKLCQFYEGKIFTEEAKVTFVLPKNKTLHKEIIESVQAELGEKYSLKAGDEVFAHITSRLEEDGKVVAIKTILKALELKENQVVTFGDMPDGNDKGLLGFPYSFTNAEEFTKEKKYFQKTPFILIDSNLTPIGRVYRAIDYLLSLRYNI